MPVRDRGRGRRHEAALADRERLRRVEREDLGVALAAETRAVLVGRAEAGGGVDEQRDARGPCGRVSHAARWPAGGGMPKVEHARTAADRCRPRSASACLQRAGSRCHERSSTSTNTGSSPAHSTALIVAANVNDGMSTSRRPPPAPTSARSASIRPSVALATGTQPHAEIRLEPLHEQLVARAAVGVPADLVGSERSTRRRRRPAAAGVPGSGSPGRATASSGSSRRRSRRSCGSGRRRGASGARGPSPPARRTARPRACNSNSSSARCWSATASRSRG